MNNYEGHTEKAKHKAMEKEEFMKDFPGYSEKFESIRNLPLAPAGTHICVRILPQMEKTSSGGILLASGASENFKKDLNVAVVIATGSDCTLTKPGMLITMSPVATSYSVWHKGEQLGILKEEQIFGIYDDPDGEFKDVDLVGSFGKEESARKMENNGYVM